MDDVRRIRDSRAEYRGGRFSIDPQRLKMVRRAAEGHSDRYREAKFAETALRAQKQVLEAKIQKDIARLGIKPTVRDESGTLVPRSPMPDEVEAQRIGAEILEIIEQIVVIGEDMQSFVGTAEAANEHDTLINGRRRQVAHHPAALSARREAKPAAAGN